MNHTRLPKEDLLPDWAHRDMQVIKGRSCIVCKNDGTEIGHCDNLTEIRSWTLKLSEKIWNIWVQKKKIIWLTYLMCSGNKLKNKSHTNLIFYVLLLLFALMFRAYGALQLLSVKNCLLFLQVAAWQIKKKKVYNWIIITIRIINDYNHFVIFGVKLH